MEKRQLRNAFLIVGGAVLAFWACSVFVRMVLFIPPGTGSFFAGLGLLMLASAVWGLVRKIRTSELTTRNVERAFTKEPGGPLWPLILTISNVFGGAIIGGRNREHNCRD